MKSCDPQSPSKSKDDSHASYHVLIFDNGDNLLNTICRGLSLYGHKYLSISNPEEIFHQTQGRPPGDVLVVDLSVNGQAGFEFIKQVHMLDPQFPILAIAGIQMTPEIKTIKEWEIRIIHKPFCAASLNKAIDSLCQSSEM